MYSVEVLRILKKMDRLRTMSLTSEIVKSLNLPMIVHKITSDYATIQKGQFAVIVPTPGCQSYKDWSFPIFGRQHVYPEGTSYFVAVFDEGVDLDWDVELNVNENEIRFVPGFPFISTFRNGFGNIHRITKPILNAWEISTVKLQPESPLMEIPFPIDQLSGEFAQMAIHEEPIFFYLESEQDTFVGEFLRKVRANLGDELFDRLSTAQ